ncbi:Do family serine endopeptidase [Parvularcula sp. IMCC14364]|uniref:Do family serine endopeptidase n=1 Tax=Parvularcula sp. IMCC14364 TaxID=3067902 RepID=UPI002741C559|nr:Do family serine endopeptidase [Parvularcula sp. IMCC14364]
MNKYGVTKILSRSTAIAALAATAFALSAPVQAQAPRLMTPSLGIGGQLSFADLVEQVSPAVVSVNTEASVPRAVRRMPEGFDEYFERRFGFDFGDQLEQEGEERRAAGQGSGFFIDREGHIVTNHHVVDGADTITVRLNDGSELEAELIGSDPATDLAVLKVDSDAGQPFVEFADNVNLRVGDWVLAVGNPFGLGGTVTSGIVSAIGRTNYASSYSDYIQVDAPINRGNSGGPTFDLNGRVVGVNTAIYSPTGGSVGIGFAIPSETAQFVVSQLIDKGSVTRGWLGVEIRPFDNNHAAAVGLPDAKGALVVNVQDNTPAKNAGMESGDIVLKFDGEEVADARELTRAVGGVEPGQTVDMLVYREGRNRTLKVKLGERDEAALAGVTLPEPEEQQEAEDELAENLGVSFRSLTADDREELNLEPTVAGVVVTNVLPGSLGAEALLTPGTVILEADRRKVTSPADLQKKIENATKSGKEALLLRVHVGGRKDFRALPLEEEE